MLPTDVPRGLDDLCADLGALTARSSQASEALARRMLHHSACDGDGSILDLIRRDLQSLQRWREEVARCTELVTATRWSAAQRLAVLAACEAQVRTLLPAAGTAAVAEVTRRVSLSSWGVGGWVACTGGTAAVPVPGDPCWAGLVELLT